MKYNSCLVLVASIAVLIASSCAKEEGIGGTSKITGKLVEINYPGGSSNTADTLAAPSEDVYIIYGDNDFFSNDIETHFDGSFQFDYLNKGKYTIFAYSKDTAGSGNDIAIKKTVEITENNETIDIGTLYVYDGLVGTSTITGKIMKLDYLANFTNVIDTSFAGNQDVYISHASGGFYFDDIETHYDGTFQFTGLTKGEYSIYVYSNDPQGTNQEVAITEKVVIKDINTVVDVGEIYIYEGLAGTSTITGRVIAVDYYYSDISLPPKPEPRDQYFAADEEVYIKYENNRTFFDRVRTNHDGTYVFERLIPGKYTIFAYTKDHNATSGVSTYQIIKEITAGNQHIEIQEPIMILK